MYNDATFGSENPPNPAMFTIVPDLAHDSFFSMGNNSASFAPSPNNAPENNNYHNMSDVIWFGTGVTATANTPFRIAQLTLKNTANGTLTYTYADSTSSEYQLYNLNIVNGVIQ